MGNCINTKNITNTKNIINPDIQTITITETKTEYINNILLTTITSITNQKNNKTGDYTINIIKSKNNIIFETSTEIVTFCKNNDMNVFEENTNETKTISYTEDKCGNIYTYTIIENECKKINLINSRVMKFIITNSVNKTENRDGIINFHNKTIVKTSKNKIITITGNENKNGIITELNLTSISV